MNPILQTCLHTWFRISRGLTLGVRGAVLDDRGRVLLVRHTYVAGWHLPGGGVETGETAGMALARELDEEAWIEILEPPVLHGIFFNGHVSRRDHVLVYAIRGFRRRPGWRPDREIAAAEFVPLTDLPDEVTAGTRARLAEITSGARPQPNWA